ncbi:MAG: hypothetical protein MJ252_23175 [archaeon]|nr:hypothetical protein [archaeon]
MSLDNISVGSIASSVAKNSTEFLKSQVKKLKKSNYKRKAKDEEIFYFIFYFNCSRSYMYDL